MKDLSRTKKFMYNTLASACYQVIIMIIGIITPRIMIMAYGSEINGLVSSVTQFVSYFTLVQAGLSNAAIYALYKPLAEQNRIKISGILSATKNFYYKSGIIFTCLLTGLSILYPMFVNTNKLNAISMSILIFAIGFNGVIDFFLLAKYSALLSADQRNYILSIGSIVSSLLNFIIVLFMVSIKANIVVLKCVAVLSVIVRSMILYIYCYKRYAYVDYHAKPDKKALDKRWSAFYLQILQVVQNSSPVVLLTFLTELKKVSVYSVYNMVILGLSSLLDIFMSGLSASFGEIISKGEQETLQKAYRDFEYAYFGLITIVYSTAMILIMPFIRIYTKGVIDADYAITSIGILSILNAFLYNLKTPQGMLVMSAGLYKETKWRSTIQAALIIIFGIILTPFWGIKGVLIALMISNIYREIDLIFYIPKMVTHLPVLETIRNIMCSILAFAINIGLMHRIINRNIRGFLEWGVYAVFVFLLATIIWCTVSIVTNRRCFFNVCNRIKVMLIRRKGRLE